MAADRGDTAGQGVERVSGVRLTMDERGRLALLWQTGPANVAHAVEAILATRLAPVEALIGGPTPPVFLSDRPNKIVRVQHRDDRLGATITESMVRVSDIVAALSQPTAAPSPDREPEPTSSEES